MVRRISEVSRSNPKSAVLPAEHSSGAMTWRDWLGLCLAVAAGGVLAWALAPHWLAELYNTLIGPKPRIFWYLGRASAFVSYGLLWLSIMMGLVMTSKLSRAWPGGPAAFDLHQSLSLMGLVFGIFHAFVLMGSKFLHYDVLDVLVPFHSDAYRTVYVALGQFALYGMAAVGLSFYVRRKISQRAWRVVHYLSFAVFVSVLIHGLQTGSDSTSQVARALYLLTCGSVVCLVVHRILTRVANPQPAGAEKGVAAAHAKPAAFVVAPVTTGAPATQAAAPAQLAEATTQPAVAPVTIVFGSQSGNSESLAKRAAKAFSGEGIAAQAMDAARFSTARLAETARLIVITSTYGEGEPPDNIAPLYHFLHSESAPSLAHMEYSVLALGDSSYATFCKCGSDFDARLAALGARRLSELMTSDTDFEPAFQTWLTRALFAFRVGIAPAVAPVFAPAGASTAAPSAVAEPVYAPALTAPAVAAPAVAPAMFIQMPAIATPQIATPQVAVFATASYGLPVAMMPQPVIAAPNAAPVAAPVAPAGATPAPAGTPAPGAGGPPKPPTFGSDTRIPKGHKDLEMVIPDRYSKMRPFPAAILHNINLHTGPDAKAKQTRAVAFSLRGSGFSYEAGDALGVMPTNRLSLVAEILHATELYKDAPVKLPDGSDAPLCDALLRSYDITRLTRAHMEYFAEHTGDPGLQQLLKPESADALKTFMYGRELVDLLLAHPNVFEDAGEFVSILGKLNPRLYSISSSQKMHPEEVHLTVGVLRYESYGRPRYGVCSNDVANTPRQVTKPVFVHPNKVFRLPADPEASVIMVGPGTGIAPFRSFLQERAATGARGRNWLFFGCQHAHGDFFYREEMESFLSKGVLTKFSVAFSRDQAEKIYVQNVMRQHAAELWSWMDQGAHFYVCGDATRMAKDVDAALQDVAVQAGGMTADQAREWTEGLRKQKRYLRDVY